MKTRAFDTETFLIGPGAVAPKMVCMSVAEGNDGGLVGNGDADIVEMLKHLFEPGHMLVGHNTAYDCVVVALSYPELEPMIWAKYAAGEITCTRVQEQLINLSTHGKLDVAPLPDGSGKKLRYSLADLEQHYFGIDRSAEKTGDDQWRMNYHLLDGKKASEYPADAAKYAVDDAVGTLRVHEAQRKRAAQGVLDVAPFHAWADFALFLITERGMAIDPERVEQVRQELAEKLSPNKLQPLVDAGILRPGEPARPHTRQTKKAAQLVADSGRTGPIEDWEPHREMLEQEGIKFTSPKAPSVNRKALCAAVEQISKANGIEVKLTESGAVSADSEVLGDLSGFSEVIKCFAERQKLQKLVTTEIPRMEWKGRLAETVHFPFRVLLETGRTSSFANRLYPSGNGQQLHPMIRPCYVARPGHLLLSRDYGTLELATLGQRMIQLFGRSVHADKINAGQDNHAFLAARMAYELWPDFSATCDELGYSTNDQLYEAFMSLKGGPADYKETKGKMVSAFKWWRDFSKPTGLGFPGALGPWTFLQFAKKSYGVDVAAIAADMPAHVFQESPTLHRIAKDKLGMEDFHWTPMTRAIALAIKLKEIWLDAYDMRPYFDHIRDLHKDSANDIIGVTDEGREIQGYYYISDFGMVRRGCSYTACANGYGMQTPAAEGAKAAGIQLVRACRDASAGSILHGNAHPVDFIHDEYLVELADEGVQSNHDRAEEVGRIMRESMSMVLPDVPGLQTEGVLMRRWDKFADPTFDDQGRLIETPTD